MSKPAQIAQLAIHTEDGRVFFDMAETDNPCFGCGCCCRHFRVSFYQGELDSQPGGVVPADLTVPVTPFRVAMKGTEHGNGRCVSQLDDGRCGIYENRPSVCRANSRCSWKTAMNRSASVCASSTASMCRHRTISDIAGLTARKHPAEGRGHEAGNGGTRASTGPRVAPRIWSMKSGRRRPEPGRWYGT